MIQRAVDRAHTSIDWLDSHHCFSFGQHYDPANTHHGLLLVHNDDIVAPDAGFDTHPHRDMEIVTWVLEGALVHQDSIGNSGVIYPGLAQRMSAGTGILHSEKNDSFRHTRFGAHPQASESPVHFIQMWVTPDSSGGTPGYEQLEVATELARGGLVPIASGMPRHRDHSAIRIGNRNAALHIGRLTPTEAAQLPAAPFAHVFVARGAIDVEGIGRLRAGDSARLTDTGGEVVTVADGEQIAEVLVWEMHSALELRQIG